MHFLFKNFIFFCAMNLFFSSHCSAIAKDIPSLEEMAGQMIMVGFKGMGDTNTLDDIPYLLKSIKKGHVGGVILFEYDIPSKSYNRNIRTLEQVAYLTHLLQENSPIPLFVGIDQEGGRVRRLKSPRVPVFDLPSAEKMGEGKPEETYNYGKKTGELLYSLGINLNFAPVVDIAINPESPAVAKIERAFSADPEQVSLHASSFAEGLATAGVISAYKHFPGHGSATEDSHLGITDITETWSEKELIPYLSENRPNIPMMIMPGHLINRNIDPHLPADLSYNFVTKLLREKLGWQGVVVSDDMQMRALTEQYSRKEAICLAILAGVDILVTGNNLVHEENLAEKIYADILELIAEGKITKERIEISYNRIMKLKADAGLL